MVERRTRNAIETVTSKIGKAVASFDGTRWKRYSMTHTHLVNFPTSEILCASTRSIQPTPSAQYGPCSHTQPVHP
jgi:hypothetical protein